MNFLAGILIGIANPTWLGRLVAPFLWGITYCGYLWAFKGHYRKRFVTHLESTRTGDRTWERWGISPATAFYLVEYGTAVSTALVVAVITGVIIGFFWTK